MKQEPPKSTNKRAYSAGEMILLLLTALFLLLPLIFFGWYGSTYIPTVHSSDIRPREVEVSQGTARCTLDIPGGMLQIRKPQRAVVGSNYQVEAQVTLERPLRFTNCTGTLPNWNINLEAQTALVSSAVKPFASIRQPAFDRDHFTYSWTFMPEENVPGYQSHLWLRAIVSEKDQTVENWNILVRDFPMENISLFGQPAIIWIIISGFSLVLGLLLGILFLQKTRKQANRKPA